MDENGNDVGWIKTVEGSEYLIEPTEIEFETFSDQIFKLTIKAYDGVGTQPNEQVRLEI